MMLFATHLHLSVTCTARAAASSSGIRSTALSACRITRCLVRNVCRAHGLTQTVGWLFYSQSGWERLRRLRPPPTRRVRSSGSTARVSSKWSTASNWSGSRASEVVALALGLGAVDHADRPLEAGLAQACGRQRRVRRAR